MSIPRVDRYALNSLEGQVDYLGRKGRFLIVPGRPTAELPFSKVVSVGQIVARL